jgi:hypothetical protein
VAEGITLPFPVPHHQAGQRAQGLLQRPGIQAAQGQQVLLPQGGQGGSQQVEHLPHGWLLEGGLLSPLFALVLPPAVKVALQAGPQAAQVLRLQAGGGLSLCPEVVHVQAHQQRVALAQAVQLGHDVHPAAQFVQGEAHILQDFGHALAGQRVQVQGAGQAVAVPFQAAQPAFRPALSGQVAGRNDDAQARRRLEGEEVGPRLPVGGLVQAV